MNIEIAGEVVGINETLYSVEVMRTSGNSDIILCQTCGNCAEIGDIVHIKGTIKSTYYKKHLIVYVDVEDLHIMSESIIPTTNKALLSGIVVMNPYMKRSTLNKILICNSMIFTDGRNYIPFIAWGSNAHILNDMKCGTRIEIEGRFQRRIYNNGNKHGEAYEVSCYRIEEVNDDDNENMQN